MTINNIFATSILPAKPDEPKGPIKFDEIDATTVTCSWNPPVRDGGAPISGYMVEQRDAHRPGWVTACESVSRPTFKFDNLIEGDEYVFRAAAINRYGTGDFLQSEIVTCKSLTSKTYLKVTHLLILEIKHTSTITVPPFPQMCLDLLVVQLSLTSHVMV